MNRKNAQINFGKKWAGHNKTHGHSYRNGKRTTTYYSWNNMFHRCTNPKHSSWKNYGERRIKVCKRWKQFMNFLVDMGEKPNGLTLDRINTNGNYEPRNCRWITRAENQKNKRP